jgi:dTDP-glucose 4,6-dehydratase
MKLLVTGGCGFIGSNFIHYWLKKHPQDDIVNLDKLTYAGNSENLKDIAGSSHYHFVKGDIGNAKIVLKLMAKTDLVVHFAAETHVDRSITGPQLFLKTNIIGTQILLDAALKAGVKHFHHVSTDEVFGALPLHTKEKFAETSVYRPNSPYAASKAGSDHLVRAYHETFNLPMTITNCSNNFGPYQNPEKLLPRAITNLIDGQKVPIYGDGLYVRDWLFVDDHCRAIEAVIKKGKNGQTYCVGGMTEDLSNLDLVKKLCRIMNKDFEQSVEYVKDRPGHDRRYAVDWRKIKKELNWQPLHGFEDWLEKTVQWYVRNEKWWRPLKSKTEKYYLKNI